MNIVNSGNQYTVYRDDIKTYKALPVGTYQITYDPQTGFRLISHHDLKAGGKVYGPYAEKAAKTMRTFKALNRNMGVILSGPKGVGKSMFARLLAEQGKSAGLPLIIVKGPAPGIEDFISSIEQECIVLFDEFEKAFSFDEQSDTNTQDSLLSLFDGIDNGKKLYVVTCNEVSKLSRCLLNRPGRFHYHFILDSPSEEEVRDYLKDELNDAARKYVENIVAISQVSSFTYDILRAIVFELNQGYGLDETLFDLNIERDRYAWLRMKLVFTNGLIAVSDDSEKIDILGNSFTYFNCYFERGKIPSEFRKYYSAVTARINDSDVILDLNGYSIDSSKVSIEWNYDSDDSEGIDFVSGFELDKVIFEKGSSKTKAANKKWKV